MRPASKEAAPPGRACHGRRWWWPRDSPVVLAPESILGSGAPRHRRRQCADARLSAFSFSTPAADDARRNNSRRSAGVVAPSPQDHLQQQKKGLTRDGF